MHISHLKTNPRNLTGGDGYTVDLGMVSLRDAAIYGRTRPLIPYAEGRLIKAVRFVPGGVFSIEEGHSVDFNTSNTSLASIQGDATWDTLGIIPSGNQTDINGKIAAAYCQIVDTGPLFFGLNEFRFFPAKTWTADTPYALEDFIIEGDYIYECDTNGVSGSEKPTFDEGPVTDGTVTWTRYILTPTGEIHVIAEVIEGVSPMPPYPATLEWVSQPTETPAGDPIPDFVVAVKDQNGDPYIFSPISSVLAILGAGTLSGSTPTIDQATGLLTFTGFSIAEAGTYTLRVNLLPCLVADPIFSDPFEITA